MDDLDLLLDDITQGSDQSPDLVPRLVAALRIAITHHTPNSRDQCASADHDNTERDWPCPLITAVENTLTGDAQ
jgi:hypothetical protein